MRSIIDCNECPLRQSLNYDYTPTIPTIGKCCKGKLFIINQSATNDAHLVDRCLGTKHDVLLREILKNAKIDEQDVYITNMVKCFTRDLTKNKSQRCIETHLEYEIEWINPKSIVILGLKPAKILLNDSVKLHNEYSMQNRPVFITYGIEFLWDRGKKYTEMTTKYLGEIYEKRVRTIKGS